MRGSPRRQASLRIDASSWAIRSTSGICWSAGKIPTEIVSLWTSSPRWMGATREILATAGSFRMLAPPASVWVIHEDADRSRPFHADYEGGDAMPGRSPTVRRRRLGIELRQLREAAHLTLEQAAGRLEFSTAKLSRIENAQVSATALDVRGMLEIYGADAKLRDALIQMAREARQRGWWQTDYGDLPIATRVGLEIAAASIRQYAGLLVPGLLQVP